MARSHTPETPPAHPNVRFERSDITLSTVVWSSVALIGIIAVLSVATIWFGRYLARSEDRREMTKLPPAEVDKNRLPPEPRLEALEDLQEGKVVLRPSRAQTYDQLPEEVRQEISDAITQLAGRLPAEKQPAPTSFGVPLPSKASSGRVVIGDR
jgi:hypothetical protein